MSITSQHPILDSRYDVLDRARFEPAAFQALDRSAGAAAGLSRLRQVELDRRWRARYVRGVRGAELVAAVPVYTTAGSSWPDAAYDPRNWGLDPGLTEALPADRCLVVGGVYDQRSGFPVRLDAAGENARDVLVAIARAAAAEERALVFPYAYNRARRALDAVTDGFHWTGLARESHFRDVDDPDRPLTSRVRGVLRRDLRLIEAAGLDTSVTDWATAEAVAAPLIADHNTRKDVPDHAEFVRMRYRQWTECPDVELVVFSAATASVGGVLTAIVWHDQLELYEIGLPQSQDSERIAVYLDLMFHQPLAYARRRGLRHIRAGTAAETPKSSRGAVFEDLSGGLLPAEATRELADAG